MTALLFSLLIVAPGAETPNGQRYPDATRLFASQFDASTDQNFDKWPDQWTRRRGAGYPHYIRMEIVEDRSPRCDRCLRIELDGGAGVAYGPAIASSALFSFVLEGYVKTNGLAHDHAYLSITLLDERHKPLQTFESEKVERAPQWQKIQLGPISPEEPRARYAMIGLHLEPKVPSRAEDLSGSASFTDLWLGRLPRLNVSTPQPWNLFLPAQAVTVTCTAAGFRERDPTVNFELEDVFGQVLARGQERLTVEGNAEPDPPGAPETANASRVGRAAWNPPLPGLGFYRVRASIQGPIAQVYKKGLSVAVVEPQVLPLGSEFGWEVTRGDRDYSLASLGALLTQSGIRWVKAPVWFPLQDNEAQFHRFRGFSDRLTAHGVEIVGMLCDPPKEVRDRFPDLESPSAADVFGAAPESWAPSLEPLLTTLAGQVRWWQLGHDRDTSFVGYPNLLGKIEQVKANLSRSGRDVNLGMGWGWVNQLPPTPDEKAPWQFLSLSADPPLSAEELAAYLDGTSKTAFQRWVALDVLPGDRYTLPVRASDLANRMLAAKVHKADAIYAANPFGSRSGLIDDDGNLNELYLPWRTAALLLGGTRHLGTVQLPRGSRNEILLRSDQAVMVVWNHAPTEEVAYLGDHLQQYDLWGRKQSPERKGNDNVLKVDALPTFVTGVHPAVARWRMDARLTRDRVPSIVGQAHDNALRVRNHFPQGVSVKAELVMPQPWVVEPRNFAFRLAANEQVELPFRVTLPLDATGGTHEARIDFHVYAEQQYRFSVYQNVQVGLGDVYLEVHTRLGPNGQLEVEQRFVNMSNAKVNFRCQLLVPNRQRQKVDVLNQGYGPDVHTYVLPNGKELLGHSLLIRAEEINGPRVLNYRFTAER